MQFNTMFFLRTYKKKKESKGFTLVEMLIYLAITVLVATTLVQALITVFRSNRNAFVNANLRNSGYSAMETMLRTIRSAQAIDVVNSTLYPSNAGILQVDITDSNGNTSIAKFATSSNGTLNFYLGSSTPTYVGPLTLNGTKVTMLTFSPMITSTSSAVRIQMTLSATAANITQTSNFYSTVILRGSY